MEEKKETTTEQVSEAPPIEEPQPPALNETSSKEADVGARIGAAVIDSLVAMGLSIAGGMVLESLSYPLFIGYMLTRDCLPFLDGQSVGKKVLNLKAVTEDGASLSGNWNPGLIRNVPMIIPVFPLVELIIMLVNKDKPEGLRRLGDQWGKTKVISLKA
ncbi:MAG: RDD family protein [Akkermansiaceae bacterium]